MMSIENRHINDFINKLGQISDREIYDKIDNIYYYIKICIDKNKAEDFLIDAITHIKDTNRKANLIIRYFYYNRFSKNYTKIPEYEFKINWKAIIKIFKKSSKDEIKYILSKMFKHVKATTYETLYDIPDDLTFGVELEYIELEEAVIQMLFDDGYIKSMLEVLNVSEDIVSSIINNFGFHEINAYDKWNITNEDDFMAPEASSRILTNSIKTYNEIDSIITLFKVLGAELNGNTGLHINIGVSYFKHNFDAIINLLILWGYTETILFKISNEVNETPRICAWQAAQSIKNNIISAIEENKIKEIKDYEDYLRFLFNIQEKNRIEELLCFIYGDLEYELKQAKNDEQRYTVFKKYMEQKTEYDTKIRYTSVNFSYMKWNEEDQGRIEFRIFNNNMNSKVILENIYLIAKLCEKSLDYIGKSDELIELLSGCNEETLATRLISLLFDDEGSRQIFYKRYNSVKDHECFKKLERK